MTVFQKLTAFFMSLIAWLTALFTGAARIDRMSYIYRDLSYGPHERQIVDIYVPKSAEGDTGVILLIHGGAWISGDKSAYQDQLRYWSQQGYVAAALNYRYVSEDGFHVNDELDDITAALTAVKTACAEHSVNASGVLLTGHSAGGHLSLLYAYARASESPIPPVAVVDRCGPVDLSQRNFIEINNKESENEMCALFSACCGVTVTPENFDSQASQTALRAVSPAAYITGNTVPTLICHGVQDELVPYSQALELDATLTENGVPHDFITFPNSGHGLGSDPQSSSTEQTLFLQYASAYLQK